MKIASETRVDLQVTSVRSTGRFGGVIFAGKDDSGISYTVVCDYTIIPDGKLIEIGQHWGVRGGVELRTFTLNGVSRTERQLSATWAVLQGPESRNLVEWIARSPDCHGVGPVKAARLARHFGGALWETIRNKDISALTQVVGESAAVAVCDAFERLDLLSTLVWLDQIKVPRQIGSKVVDYFGRRTKEHIEANPYLLIAFEAKWSVIDELSTIKLGIAADDARRLEGAVEEALCGAMRDGHLCLPAEKLRARLRRLLRNRVLVEQALEQSRHCDRFVWVDDSCQGIGAHLIEEGVAARLLHLCSGEACAGQRTLFDSSQVTDKAREAALREFEADNFPLEDAQREAVTRSATAQCSLILGGAGTGKTTVLKALYHVLEKTEEAVEIHQMALAGRAAQRMEQATGRPSSTIASFLATCDSTKPGARAVVVVDEMSMVDALLMYRLLSAIPSGTRLVLVGDPAQLPPIGPGLVLHALVRADIVPKTQLTVVRRQSAGSAIPHVAAAVRSHQVPAEELLASAGSGVSFICTPNSQLSLSAARLYRDLGGTGSDNDVQILSTTRQGPGGVVHLNQLLHEQFGSQKQRVMIFSSLGEPDTGFRTLDGLPLYVGDLVMQTTNDNESGLRNGVLGRVAQALPCNSVSDPCCVIEFEGVRYKFNASQLHSLRHSYAITVHKSQGSQFRKVVVPVRQSRLLDHALIYTALTRAVETVIFIGDRGAFERAIRSPAIADSRSVTLPARMKQSHVYSRD